MGDKYRVSERPLWSIDHRGVRITAYEAVFGPSCCGVDNEPIEGRFCGSCGKSLKLVDGLIFEVVSATDVAIVLVQRTISNTKDMQTLAKEWVDRHMFDREDDLPPENEGDPVLPAWSDPPPPNYLSNQETDPTVVAKVKAAGWPGKAAEIWNEFHDPRKKKRVRCAP